MNISDHRLVGVSFRPAHAFGGAMAEPTLIILHDTAGQLTKGNSVEWFCSTNCGTSAHVVVERDGSITQLVPFDHIAFHAGKSSYKGKSVKGSCNAFSIGIEIVNPGKLDKNGRAWFHRPNDKGFPGAQKAVTREHGAGWWLDYTPEQIEAVKALCAALVDAYPSITDISTHWFVSPGRKEDTNPLFPLDNVRATVFHELLESLAPTTAAVPEGSRKQTMANVGQATTAGAGVGLLGLSMADALGYGGQILSMVKTYGVEAVILLAFVAAIGFAAIKHFTRQDFEEGRYTPSGAPK